MGNERQGAVGHPHLCIHDISWRARDISWSPSIIGEQKGGPTLRAGLETWMERKGLLHIDDVRGRASLRESPDPGAFERALYIRALHSWKTA